MDKISIKAYAKKHKLSIFNVVKMVKSGKLPTETIIEEDKEVIYILIDEVVEKEVSDTIFNEEKNEPYSLRKENVKLKKEIESLRQEIIALKKRV